MPNPEPEKDPFYRETIYPDAQGLIAWVPKTLEQVKATAFVVIDTNALLVPYTAGKTNLEEIAKIYRSLIASDRLIIPGQVMREFASNRVVKLKELNQQLVRNRNSASVTTSKYPLLDGLEELSDVIEAEKRLQEAINNYTGAIDKLLVRVRNWYWDDPVTILYSELFGKGIVQEPTLDKSKLKEDLSNRIRHKIPPGYKDAGKDDGGMGDLIIWHTILKAGLARKTPVIFVSNDQKADWWDQSEGAALYPRFELVDEYRRHSAGGSFHIVTFSAFLDLMGATKSLVNEVYEKEQLSNQQEDAETYASTDDDMPTYARKRQAWWNLQEDVYGMGGLPSAYHTDEIRSALVLARDAIFRGDQAEFSRLRALLQVLINEGKVAWNAQKSLTS